MQNYKNHVKWFPGHHFVFSPVSFILLIFSFYKFFSLRSSNSDLAMVWLFLALAFILIIWAAGMLRAHYSLKLQDRIVIDELNFRFYRITGKTLDESEFKFSDKQLIALRFAPDEELLDLMKTASQGNLSPNQIKQKIKNWKEDYRRV